MTKKHFIALADMVREYNRVEIRWADKSHPERTFNESHLDALAGFCQAQNPQFNRQRWLGYIAGTNGRNGGKVKV